MSLDSIIAAREQEESGIRPTGPSGDQITKRRGSAMTQKYVGQGQQTEFFNNSLYAILIVLMIWVFLICMEVPTKAFKIFGARNLIDEHTGKISLYGAGVVSLLTVVIYLFAAHMNKR